MLAGLTVLGAGCSSSPAASPAVAALRTGLPVSEHGLSLNTALVASVPDAGCYVDPTYLHFYYLGKVQLRDALPLLCGWERRDAWSLQNLGPLLEVVVWAANAGASTTAADLTESLRQSGKTSELDPSGVGSALQKTYYRPIRSILVLSSDRLDMHSADVNPGAEVWMLAVLPPVNTSIKLALIDPALVKPKGHGFCRPRGRALCPLSCPPPSIPGMSTHASRS
jgi:hypothetical protein